MDVFEVNKIVGAILGTGLLIMALNEVGNLVVSPGHLEESVYSVVVEEEAAAEPSEAMAETKSEHPESLAALLASADVDAGRKTAKKCVACHSLDAGGGNKVGPNLWNIVGRDKAGAEGFNYSGAMAEADGTWSYEDLDHFLADPKGFMSGTKMSFAGIKDAAERANVIAFLRSLSDSPQPLPDAE